MNKKASDKLASHSRRKLLVWTPPVVTSMMLPAHAQTSAMSSLPTMNAATPSKCSGNPPVGQAILTILSDGSNPQLSNLQVTAISVSGAAASDSIVLPSLPATITTSTGIDIEWTGNAIDATTCLPVSPIVFDVTYEDGVSVQSAMITFDMTIVLSDAIP